MKFTKAGSPKRWDHTREDYRKGTGEKDTSGRNKHKLALGTSLLESLEQLQKQNMEFSHCHDRKTLSLPVSIKNTQCGVLFSHNQIST